MQRDVGLDALDHHFRERVAHARDGRLARVSIGDHLADHRIVERRHVVAGVDVAVDANPGAARRVPEADRARRRREVLRVLGIDAALHRMAADLDVALCIGQRFARGDQQLRLDDVDARDELRDRVFDLHASVHFDEIEFVVLIQKFERACVAVADFAAGPGTAFSHGLALFRSEPRRRRLLDDFLMTALHRTIALAQVHDVAVIVGKHLELDVPRSLEKFLHVHFAVAECGKSLRPRHADRVQQRGVGMHDAHAAAAAAARSLDDHGVTDVLGDTKILVRILPERAIRSWYAGHPGGFHDLDCRDLVAHEPDGLGPRPHEDEPAFLDAFGEIGVLR